MLAAQSSVLALTLGREWLVLFVYVSIASGAALPPRLSRWTIPGACALMTGLAFAVPDGKDLLWGLLVPALLGGFAMTGVRELIRTTVALREARATVAHLAANEERLRLARDLHDLLGHSLSLITLKSELAGRMLPDHPDRAAQQVADIEQVSRQALVDVREAVTGYRRPRLAGELSGARVALRAAGSRPACPTPTTSPVTCPRTPSPPSPGRCARPSPTSSGTAAPGAARWTWCAARPSTARCWNSRWRTTARAAPRTSPATVCGGWWSGSTPWAEHWRPDRSGTDSGWSRVCLWRPPPTGAGRGTE